MSNIVLLTTDTLHHVYFANVLTKSGIDISDVVFETTSVSAPFQTGPVFEDKEQEFEENNFRGNITWRPYRIHKVENTSSPEAFALLKSLDSDLALVFGTRRLPKTIIDMFNGNLINVHRGITSRYRGLDSDLWAIYHNDFKNIGVTLHYVDTLLDTGCIITEEKMNLLKGMKCHQIRYYTTIMASEMMVKVINKYHTGNMGKNKRTGDGRYYSFMPIELKRIVEERFNKFCADL
jgi:methionyl-tRNA formyltransferase